MGFRATFLHWSAALKGNSSAILGQSKGVINRL